MKTELFIITFCILMLTFSGCMIIWSDDVFVCTVFKAVDANDLDLIAEPNYLQVGSGSSRTKNDKIEAIVPGVGIIKTKGE